MNILIHFRTRSTGAEAVHLAGMAGGFETLGHPVVFSSPTGVDPRQTAGRNPFAEHPSRVPRALFEALEIGYNGASLLRNGRLLRAGRFGLIYERHAFFLCTTPLLAKHYRVPLVLEVNELVGDARIRPQPYLPALVRCCDRILFRRADLIVTVSPYLKRRVEAAGARPDRVIVLPNAVSRDTVAAAAGAPAAAAVRARYGLGDEVVIGFVGWFAAWHRIELLVEAFARCDPARHRLRLLLVAEGDRRALEELAIRRGVRDRVVFAGAVPHAEVPAHVAAMDLCVVPNSNQFRSPIKLFEYMAQGRTPVAPKVEPIEMVVRDGVNGLLFEPLAADSLAAALRRAAADPALRDRLGARARADVLAHHTWDRNAETVLARLFPPR